MVMSCMNLRVANFLDNTDWTQLNDFGILSRLLNLKQQLGMVNWLLEI